MMEKGTENNNSEMELLVDAALKFKPQEQQQQCPLSVVDRAQQDAACKTPSSLITPKPKGKNVREINNDDTQMTHYDESGSCLEREAFIKELENFYRDRSLEFKPPKFYGQPLNWLKLWRAVIRLGGHEVLTASKSWRQVGDSFHPPKTCTTVSWMFRTYYEKVLLEFEKHKREIGELQLPVGPFRQSSHVKRQIGSRTKKTIVTKVKPIRSIALTPRCSLQSWSDEEEEAGQKRKRKVTPSSQSLAKQPTPKIRKTTSNSPKDPTSAPKTHASMETASPKGPPLTTPDYANGLKEVPVQYKEEAARELQKSFQHQELFEKALVVHSNPLGLELISTTVDVDQDVKTHIPHDSSNLPSLVHQSKPIVQKDIEDEVADSLVVENGDILADLPDECELLAEMERVLSESFHCNPPKTTPAHYSVSDGPSLPAITLLLNIRDVLDTAVDALAEDGEFKQQLLDNLNQLAQLEAHLPAYLLTVATKVRQFFEDFHANFPPAQETLTNHQKLVVSRNRLQKELESAKEKRASFSNNASRIKDELSEINEEEAALEAQLKALKERKAKLQEILKCSDSETHALKKNIVLWLKQSREVVDNLKASEVAAKEARMVKETFKQKLVELKQSFHIIKP